MRRTRLLMLTLATVLVSVALLAICAAAVEEDPPAHGDWMVTGTKEYTGKTGFVNGSLIINMNAKLTIKDSDLTINNSLTAMPLSTLIIQNSIIRFNCSLSLINRFEILGYATVTILDGDGNRSTTNDASHITSTTDIEYNWVVLTNGSLEVHNSFISYCGRYSPGPRQDDGLWVQSKNVWIEGTEISHGYYGVILDNAEDFTMENVTVRDCQVGLLALASRTSKILSCRFLDNDLQGVQIRGYHTNLLLKDNVIERSGVTDLFMVYTLGSNDIDNCTIGPGGPLGAFMEDVSEWSISDLSIDGCLKGIEINRGDFNPTGIRVSNCTQGLEIRGSANVRITDLQLLNTSVTIRPEARVNITLLSSITWSDVVADLASEVWAQPNSVLNILGCHISFRDLDGNPTGLYGLGRSLTNIDDSLIDSPISGQWILWMAEGSKVDFLSSTFRDVGTSTQGMKSRGIYIAGSGTLENITIADSLVGLVIGRTIAEFVNVTIRDCLTGIVTDGSLAKGGALLKGLVMEGCNVSIMGINEGSLSINEGTIGLGSGEGINLTQASLTLRDSWVGDPAPGQLTAILRDHSNLNLVNSVSSRQFDIGPNSNFVNIYWHLDLNLAYLSSGAPLPDATVTVKEASGSTVLSGIKSGADGTILRMELREKAWTPSLLVTTPHTIVVAKDGLTDSFSIVMDTSKEHSFMLDNYPPVLTIDSPDNDTLHSASTLTFTGEAYDAVITETDGLGSMNYRVDGGDWIPIPLPSVKTWSFDVTMEDGTHFVEVEVRDRIGNRNVTSVRVTLDTEVPSLVLFFPEEGSLTNRDTLLVIGRTDPTASLTINDDAVVLAGDGSFNHTFTLEEGANLIVVRATDELGNTALVTRNVTLDTTPPEVVLDHEGSWITREPTAEVSGSKEVNTSIYVNGFLHQFFGSDTFTTMVDLLEDDNPVSIFSVDLAGNNWSTTIIIHRDSTPPSLLVTRLPTHTNKATVTIQGSTDDAGAIVTVNGVRVDLIGLAFSYTVTLVEGANTISVEARDPLGNEATPDVQTVNLDTVPPVLEIETPKYMSTIKDELNLSGTTEPGLPVRVFVTYAGYSKTYNLVAGPDGSFKVEVTLPQVGNHSVTVTVLDLAGNEVSDDLYFNRLRADTPEPPKPEESSWMEDYWVYLVLLAAVFASLAVWMLALSGAKQRRATPGARTRSAPTVTVEDEEDWEEEGDPEDEAVEEEDEAEWSEDGGDEPDEEPAEDEERT